MAEELKQREPDVWIVLGRQRVGKTYYQKALMLEVGKRRKALVFDCNVRSGSYSGVRAIQYINNGLSSRDRCAEIIKWNQHAYEFCRVTNYRTSENPPVTMDANEMNQAALDLMEHFQDGSLVLEDMNVYLFGARQKKFIQEFVRPAHKNVDLFLILQGWVAVDPRIIGNASMIRLYKTLDSCDNKRKQLADSYEIMKIAELMINLQYERGNKRFFLIINRREEKILGGSEAGFRWACKQYMSMNTGELKRFMNMKQIENKEDAIHEWTEIKLNDYYRVEKK